MMKHSAGQEKPSKEENSQKTAINRKPPIKPQGVYVKKHQCKKSTSDFIGILATKIISVKNQLEYHW